MEFTNKKPNTMAVYTVRKATKILFYVIGGLMLAGGLYLTGLGLSGKYEWMLLLSGIFLNAIAVIGYLDLKVSKLIITDYSIRLEELFKTRELSIADIKGFSIEGSKLYIKPASKFGKTLYISNYTVLENREELFGWLTLNVRNIDTEEYQEGMAEILTDDTFGKTNDERVAELKKSKRFCSYFNYTGAAVCIWLVNYPRPYDYAVLAGLIYPLLVMVVFYLKRDIVTFNSGNNIKSSLYPALTTALFMPSVGLLLRDLKDYRLLHVIDVLLPALVVTVILGAVFFSILMGAREKTRSNSFTRFNAVLFVILYALVAPATINCNFDYGIPKVYPVQVLKQTVYTGKYASYNLALSKWGPNESGEIEVSKQLYEQVKKGDTVHVIVKPGLFKMKWFYVAR